MNNEAQQPNPARALSIGTFVAIMALMVVCIVEAYSPGMMDSAVEWHLSQWVWVGDIADTGEYDDVVFDPALRPHLRDDVPEGVIAFADISH